MLSEAQLAHLEHLVHSISTELHIEEATLDAQQTCIRSGCESLALAMLSPHGVPCRHGNTACIIP
jgi:hypothetical protein